MTEQEIIRYIKDTNRKNDMLCILPKSDIGEYITKALEELEQYRAIGTVEECRAAVEKQKAKKPTPIDYKKYMNVVKNAKFLKGAFWCPNCNHAIRNGDYCDDCGQKLDWSDEE